MGRHFLPEGSLDSRLIAVPHHNHARLRLALTLGVWVVLLCLVPAASGATTVTGDRDTSVPLVIDPTVDPADPQTADVPPGASGRVAFIQRMPVTKIVSQVTLGDFATAPGCSSPVTLRLHVAEHTDGDMGSSSVTVASSSGYQPVPATPSRITWPIPPTTLRAGRGYSFELRRGGCTAVRQTTWAHPGSTVNGGSSRCTVGPPAQPSRHHIDNRMWHAAGADDRQLDCSNASQETAFHPTMPEGWLMTRTVSLLKRVASGIDFPAPPSATSLCGQAAAAAGAQVVWWRFSPTNPFYSDYVCMWPQYEPLDQTTAHGWYYGLPWKSDGTGAPRDVYLKLDTIDYGALLAAHLPGWSFDEEENFFPQKVDAFTENWVPVDGGGWLPDPRFTNILYDGSGEELAVAGSPGGEFAPPLFSWILGDEYVLGPGNEVPSATGDNINARGNDEATYSADSARMYEAGHDDIVYGRVVHDPQDGKLWVQYWLFYYYNSFEVIGFGVHEGDWEMIQVGLDAQLNPNAVTFSAHNTAYGCTWEQTEHVGPNGSPVAYVAARSHASYPHAGETELDAPAAVDRHRGTGTFMILPLQEVLSGHRWPSWRGRWGGSTGGAFQSPMNPSQQGDKWTQPSAFHNSHVDPATCG
jgi:hypothetical protein